MAEAETYFRRGLGLKKEVQPVLDAEYHSAIVAQIKAAEGHTATFGDVTVKLAEEFGFCYGVDRAVDYAYQTAMKFPDRRIYLVGEIIHNPHVNQRMREMGITFIYPDPDGRFDFGDVRPEDVVILPAFGVTLHDFETLKGIGCILIDTTCGSVLNVWKRVDSYARDGFTAIIHGKYQHEETRATASQVNNHGGRYVIVRNMDEARLLMDYIEAGRDALDRDALIAHFRDKASPDFDPDRDLVRVGAANQTTMLSTESLAIANAIGASLARRYGADATDEHFRSFDTICSATQERQDAVKKLMEDPPDIMIVIGGYNSSNTNHLAHLCREYARTYHISDATCIDPEAGTIRHKPELDADAPELREESWLPAGPIAVGFTAGASTPNNKIGETLERLLATRGIGVPELA
ncbi:MAG TPA: 4-hydroxy-3-methylbut-2-enyl diphosphate reductase [Longimicrobiales bacterium]|nr:4-hydroxy-3-methylbut-2-enyl diphosphate reductase [Longimicrobiales bacterium]